MKFLENIPSWKKFPDAKTMGYFLPMGNFISLSEYRNEEDFEKSHKHPNLDKDRYSVFIHEQQHYYDHVSTLWGIKKIYKIYEAYSAYIEYDEYLFYKFRELELDLKREYFLEYYTESYADVKGSFVNKWKVQITSGLRFSALGTVDENHPIPFVVFKSEDEQKISRVPISVVALLESTATYYEFLFLLNEAQKLESPYREIQIDNVYKKLEKLLFDSELTLYSAAVHIVIDRLQISDPIVAYRVSSIFAKIALNIPSNLFHSIKIQDSIVFEAEWRKRASSFVKNADRGFAFYLLVTNYLEKYGAYNQEYFTVDMILDASDLPGEQKVSELLSEEIMEMYSTSMLETNHMNREINDKVFFGNKFRQQTGIGQQNTMGDLSQFIRDKPYLIFGETYFEYENLELSDIVEKLQHQVKLSREEWFKFYTECEKRIDSFNLICGI